MSRTTEALIIALVRRAARTAPATLSARLEEEWLADMHERTSGLSRLRFAVGCYWAGIAIGLQHRPFHVPVASGGHANASVLVEPPRFFSSRAVTFGLVLSLHAAIFCGLMMAGTKYFKPPETPAIQPRVIDRPAVVIKAPPGEFRHFVIDRREPPRLPPIEPDTKGPAIVGDANPVPPQPPATPANPRQVVRVPGGTGATFPHPDDYYPDASRRLEEQGATTLQVCVDPTGRLTSDPEKTETSGSARLDAAAVRLAKVASGHYRPTTEDGRPVLSCYPIKIRFQLRD